MMPERCGGAPEFEAGNNPPAQVRALLEGQFLNMRLHSRWMELATDRILLTGGASRNDGIAHVVAHASYLLNIASPDRRLRERSTQGLILELERCEALGISLEVIDRPGWAGGNAMAFLISGTGRRTAEAADKLGGSPATLTVRYSAICLFSRPCARRKERPFS